MIGRTMDHAQRLDAVASIDLRGESVSPESTERVPTHHPAHALVRLHNRFVEQFSVPSVTQRNHGQPQHSTAKIPGPQSKTTLIGRDSQNATIDSITGESLVRPLPGMEHSAV